MSQDSDSADARGGDDPPIENSDTFDSANEEMEMNIQLKRTGISDSDSNEEVDKNVIKRMKSNTGAYKKTNTEKQIEVIDKNEQEFQQVNRMKRKDKTKDDKVYDDGWIKNSIYTTFFIEPKLQDEQNKNDQNKSKRIHVMEVAKILHNIEVKNYKSLTVAGKNRFKVTFDKPKQAEALINSKLLADCFKYNVYVPNMFKQTIGVVRNIPPSITEEEIQANIVSNKKIQKIERIKRMLNKELISTYSVKIFVEGEKLPEEITLYGIPAKVEVYIFPLRICFNCWRYGHKAKACKAKIRCKLCGLEHSDKDCQSAIKKCVHCNGEHIANDYNCPERHRQDQIRTAMAKMKLTFSEASKQYARPNRSQQIRLQSQTEFPPLNPIPNLRPNLNSTNVSPRVQSVSKVLTQ